MILFSKFAVAVIVSLPFLPHYSLFYRNFYIRNLLIVAFILKWLPRITVQIK